MKDTSFRHSQRVVSNNLVSTNSNNQPPYEYTFFDAMKDTAPLLWGILFSFFPILVTAFLAWTFSPVGFWSEFLQSPEILIVGITIFVSYVLSKKSLGTSFVLFNTVVIFIGIGFYVVYHTAPYVGQFNISQTFTMVFNPCYCMAELIICFMYTYLSNRKTQ